MAKEPHYVSSVLVKQSPRKLQPNPWLECIHAMTLDAVSLCSDGAELAICTTDKDNRELNLPIICPCEAHLSP